MEFIALCLGVVVFVTWAFRRSTKHDSDREALLVNQPAKTVPVAKAHNNVVEAVATAPVVSKAVQTPTVAAPVVHSSGMSSALDVLQRAMDRAASEGRAPAGLCAYKTADRITFLGLAPAKQRTRKPKAPKVVLPASELHPIHPTLPASETPDQEEVGIDPAHA